MAQDRKKALDDKTRKLAGEKIENGKEHAAYQETQQQLLAIQAEQQQNLAVARAESKASFENNQTLAQAAELGAISAAEAEQAAAMGAQAGTQLNPATQQILSKYGAGQPRFQRTQSHSQQVTKQNITINNNITSNTTNDVKVPSNTGGPLQGRPLQFKSPSNSTGEGSLGKFKTWISAAFARQNEEGAKRDREYRHRESSLTKSASKMMKKLEDIGKTIGSRMDPRKIGSTWQSQLKTLLLLFGFGYLTSNWTKVLDTVSKIESWVKNTWDYFNSGKFSEQFSEKLTYYLGGNKGEHPIEAFSKLLKEIFTDDSPGSLLGGIKGFFNEIWDNRAKAIESIKFPEIDLTNISGAIQSIGQYLGDLLSAVFGGNKFLNNRVNDRVVSGVAKKLIDNTYTTNSDSVTKQTLSLKNSNGTEFKGDQGVMSIFYNKYKGLTRYSLNENGSLNENNLAEASVGTASDIIRIKDKMKEGDLSEAAGMTLHLNNLYKASEKSIKETGSGIPVSANFLKSIFTEDELQTLQKSKDIKKSHYDVVLKEKTKEDWRREGLDANANALKVGLSSAAISEVSKLLGHDWAGKLANLFENGGLSAINPLLGATAEKYGTEIRKFFENNKRFTIIKNASPNDPGYTGIKQLVYEVSPKVIEKAAAKLATGDFNSTIDINNRSDLQKLIYGHARGSRIEELNNQINNYDSDLSSYKSYLPWNVPKTAYNQVVNKQLAKSELKELYEAGKDETGFANLIEPEIEEDEGQESEHRFQKMKSRIKESVSEGIDTIKEKIDKYTGINLTGSGATNFNTQKLTVQEGDRGKYAIKRLMKEGLTLEQAAGIVGNMMKESSLNPKAGTKDSNGKWAGGIVGWNGENYEAAKRYFGRDLKDVSFEDQLEYLIKEMKGEAGVIKAQERHGFLKKHGFKTGANVMDVMKTTTSLQDSTDTFERIFEGSGDYDGYWIYDDNGNRVRRVNGDRNKRRNELAASVYKNSGGDLSNISYVPYNPPQSSLDSNNEPKKEEQKSFLQILRDKVTEFITSFGGILDMADDKLEHAYSSISEKINPTEEKFDGRVTSEFTSFNEYLNHQDSLPNGLPPGMTYEAWRLKVQNITGKTPDKLELSSESDRILGKYIEKPNFPEIKIPKEKETVVSQVAPSKTVEPATVTPNKDEDFLSIFDPKSYQNYTMTFKDISNGIDEMNEKMNTFIEISAINGNTSAEIVAAVDRGTAVQASSSRTIAQTAQAKAKNTTKETPSLKMWDWNKNSFAN